MQGTVVREIGPCMPAKGPKKRVLQVRLTSICNMHCRFCVRERTSDGREWREGIGATVMTVDAATELLSRSMGSPDPPEGVEITGPGEPLLDASTYLFLRRLHGMYPQLFLSVRTNGILLQERIGDLIRSGCRGVTLFLNAATMNAGERIFESVIFRGRRYEGSDAARIILQQQWTGLEQAIEAGLAVSVQIARIARVNEEEIDRIASLAEMIGAERVSVTDFDGRIA